MTTYVQETKICSVCGSSVECLILNSTSTFGAPDLDLRPAEMQRSTMHTWLQECDNCNYVAKDLQVAVEGAKETIASAEYQLLLSEGKFPDQARRFLRHALLISSDHYISGSANLHAAWVCDDHGETKLAAQCREKACECFSKLMPFEDAEEATTRGAILVDVFRRTRQFSQSIELSKTLQTSTAASSNPIIRQVLMFQETICENQDDGRYTLDDVSN